MFFWNFTGVLYKCTQHNVSPVYKCAVVVSPSVLAPLITHSTSNVHNRVSLQNEVSHMQKRLPTADMRVSVKYLANAMASVAATHARVDGQRLRAVIDGARHITSAHHLGTQLRAWALLLGANVLVCRAQVHCQGNKGQVTVLYQETLSWYRLLAKLMEQPLTVLSRF